MQLGIGFAITLPSLQRLTCTGQCVLLVTQEALDAIEHLEVIRRVDAIPCSVLFRVQLAELSLPIPKYVGGEFCYFAYLADRVVELLDTFHAIELEGLRILGVNGNCLGNI